eukprot:jgi/Ulvmu1/5681/UM024_0028.1
MQDVRRILQEPSAPLTQAAPTPLDDRSSNAASTSATSSVPLSVNSTASASPQSRPRPPPSPPPTQSPGTAAPPDSAHGSQRTVQLFPADVAIVYNLTDLQDAFSRNARDIEIRSHLDLRKLPLSENPYNLNIDGVGTDLAFLSWPTRSVRGNCTVTSAASPEGTDREAQQLQRLQAELQGDSVPLKPFQCLLLTNANTFYLNEGNGFWLDNLYFGITWLRHPALGHFERSAAGISSGRWSSSMYNKPMNIFATNITMHGHGQSAFFTRVVSLTPHDSRTSALFQDCVFDNLVGRDPPFLIASGTYATFRNCLFRSVSLHRSELFDVSFFGTVSLQSCYFSDVSSGNGLVDTTYNDYVAVDYDNRLWYGDYDFRRAVNGEEDHAGYDIALAPAPDAVAALYGADRVVVNETLSDCLAAQFYDSDFVLPGCPSDSVSVRRARVNLLSAPEAASPIDYVLSPGGESISFLEDYQEARTQRRIKRSNPFYDSYYEYPETNYAASPYDAAPWPDADAGPSPATDFSRAPYVIRTLGQQLTLEHPWFLAMTELLPRHPPAPPDIAAAFYNGLPICTDCSGAQPSQAAVHSSTGMSSTAPATQASDDHVPTAVLSVISAAAMLLLLAAAVCVLFLCRKRRSLTRSAREGDKCSVGAEQVRPGDRGSLADDWDGGIACPTARLHARSMHASLTEDLKESELSRMERCPGVGLMASGQHTPSHAQLASALNPEYEYRLPPGLGLAMYSSTEGGTREIIRHTQPRSSRGAGWGGTATFSAMSCSGPSSMHPQVSTESQEHSGSGHKDCSCSTSRGTWSYVPLPSTQAPQMDVGTAGTDVAAISQRRLRRVVQQLNSFSRDDLFLGRFEVLGPRHRRHGGQAVVQFVVDPKDGREFAVKFFLQEKAFRAEAALYAASFPALRSHLSRGLLAAPPEPEANTALLPPPPPTTAHHRAAHAKPPIDSQAASSDATETTLNSTPCVASETWVVDSANLPQTPATFLPQLEAVCDDAVDLRGRRLPPCIVMEKGESLQDWSNRAEPDLFTSLAVLSNVAARLAVMHDVGYVHRDLKPANVMWLPRENRWTVIDFGCVARIGELASLSFTLAYAAPEVVVAHEAGAAQLEASAALDAWSLGVMAYELLTGAPAFKFLTDGHAKVWARDVMCMLRCRRKEFGIQ